MRTKGRAASFVAAALLLSFGVGPVAVPLAAADTQRVSVTTLRAGSLVIAHRGASAVAPENTLPAMRKAAADGADMVEFDVQRTADGTLVVVHDKTFARTTDVASVFPGREHDPISSFTWSEVQRLDAGSWFSPTYVGTRIPSLAQLLQTLRPLHIRLLLELKNPTLYPGYEKQVAHELQQHGYVGSHRVWVHSFDADSLERLHDRLPSVPVGLITETGTVPSVDSTWLSSVNALSTTVTDARTDTAMRDGSIVLSWPPSGTDSPRRIDQLVDDGVRGIITNRPAQVLRTLGR
jgi:glycerophosphoryl diester phosphodiesterase